MEETHKILDGKVNLYGRGRWTERPGTPCKWARPRTPRIAHRGIFTFPQQAVELRERRMPMSCAEFVRCLRDGSTFSRFGASGKPGAVQADGSPTPLASSKKTALSIAKTNQSLLCSSRYGAPFEMTTDGWIHTAHPTRRFVQQRRFRRKTECFL